MVMDWSDKPLCMHAGVWALCGRVSFSFFMVVDQDIAEHRKVDHHSTITWSSFS
jgi:hypothetical protein